MKKTALLILLSVCSIAALAQDEKDSETGTGGFRKDLLFAGGNLNLLFGTTTVLGATPELGYNVAKWLDAGLSFGYTYTRQSDNIGNRYRQSLFAPGTFVRIFPVEFLYASALFEHNIINQKAIYYNGQEAKQNVNAASLLLGIGYASGREGRNSPYYYFSISLDVLSNINSPYRDVVFTPDANSPGGYRLVYNDPYPVVKAGLVFPLFQGSRRR